MGWRDRDWAKLDDDELAKLYGVVPRRRSTLRMWIWSIVALLLLTAGGVAYTQRTTTVAFTAPPPADKLIGMRGTNAAVPAEYPGGSDTVCGEESLDAATQQWTCLAWEINIRHLPVVQPPAYVGACTHLLADQERARWICLAADPTPPQPEPVPPSSALNA